MPSSGKPLTCSEQRRLFVFVRVWRKETGEWKVAAQFTGRRAELDISKGDDRND